MCPRGEKSKMPHQCVHCGELYDDNAKEIIEGCSKCQSRLFFFIRKERLEHLKKIQRKLSDDEITRIEQDVREMIGEEVDREKPIVLDLESVRIDKQGTYLLDLVSIFNKQPLVYKISEGKYYIDLGETFKNFSLSSQAKK
jgi:predicted  nucleic acid-binding Zn-ribbon protein